MIRTCCPACNSIEIQARFEKNGFSIWECGDCGTLFVHDLPTPGELDNIYASNEYYELPDESVARIRREGQRRLDLLPKYTRGNSILDIGCARGDFLDEAQRRGYTTYGIELSLQNAEIARAKKHTIFHGDLEAYCVEHRTSDLFDVVSCLDVIEHIGAPANFLRRAAALLKDDGVMILTTPNYSGIVARMLKDKDPYIIPPEHLNFFTKEGMNSLFRTTGLLPKLYQTFGGLTEQELKRVVPKYFPGFARKFSGLFEFAIPIVLSGFNLLKVGMEQEFYLARSKTNA